MAVAGVTVTEATGTSDTVTVTVLVSPSMLAVTVAVPNATAVTNPEPDTVATAVLLLFHVLVRPVRVFPPASLGVADSCAVPPKVNDGALGVTVTKATGTGVGGTGTGVIVGGVVSSPTSTATDLALVMTTVACPPRLMSTPVQATDPVAETVKVTLVPCW